MPGILRLKNRIHSLMNTTKLVQEAPYHPGYEDAVIEPAFAYKGVDPAKMIWKSKPLSSDDIDNLFGICALNPTVVLTNEQCHEITRAIEQRHGIK